MVREGCKRGARGVQEGCKRGAEGCKRGAEGCKRGAEGCERGAEGCRGVREGCRGVQEGCKRGAEGCRGVCASSDASITRFVLVHHLEGWTRTKRTVSAGPRREKPEACTRTISPASTACLGFV